jgi:hypothetical protein
VDRRAGAGPDRGRPQPESLLAGDGPRLPDGVTAAGVFAWAALFGCIGWEILGQYGGDGLGDPEALFEHHLQMSTGALGLS